MIRKLKMQKSKCKVVEFAEGEQITSCKFSFRKFAQRFLTFYIVILHFEIYILNFIDLFQ